MPLLGEFAALLTAIFWSATSMIFTSATRRLGAAMQINIDRMIIACIMLVFTIPFIGASLDLNFGQFGYLALSGIVGLVFGDSFLFKAFQTIGARISMLLLSLAPAIASLLAYIFMGEGLSLWGIIGMFITIFGIAIVTFERKEQENGEKHKLNKLGILYGFFGALGQGVGLVLAKMAFTYGDVNGFSASLIRLASSVVIIVPLAILTKRYKNPLKAYALDKKAFGLTTAGAVFGPYLGISLSMIAVAHAKMGIASTIMATPPVIMLPAVALIYKEKLSPISIIGAFIAVGGVAILFLK